MDTCPCSTRHHTAPTTSIQPTRFNPDYTWQLGRCYDLRMALQAKPQGAGQLPIVHAGHEYEVLSVAFSPDGKSVASGSLDNTIRI
ncbi:hypothetical protein B0J17DRAFT_640237 [Rhizoctonia solani]|nr:hypothetical protein B0J17DRAFT_640237 [Rhizoctonia solani]